MSHRCFKGLAVKNLFFTKDLWIECNPSNESVVHRKWCGDGERGKEEI